MERQFKILKWDGFHFGAVLTHWPQENTTAGTVWRFVMDRGQTLIAVPYQTPDNPAPANHCIPQRIEPILAAGRFGFAVRYAAGVNVNLEDCGELESHAKMEKEFAEWKAEQDFPTLAEYEKARRKARKKIDTAWKKARLLEENLEQERKQILNADADDDQKKEQLKAACNQWQTEREKISEPLLAPLKEIQESDEYKAEKARRDKKQDKIFTAHEKRVEREKAAREKKLIDEALEELRQTLAEHGAKRIEKKWRLELFDFIRQDVCGGNIMNPAIGNDGFERIIAEVKKQTGKDITESVLMECEAWRLAHESGAEGLERVRWVAVFPDGRQTLIESLMTDIHNRRDADLFEKVKPSDEEREIIERVIVQERQADEKKRISEIRSEAGRKNKRTTEQEDRDISKHYWELRKPKDPDKKSETKNKAGKLTKNWIVRAKVNGGYGRPDLGYSPRQIQRKAGDAK